MDRTQTVVLISPNGKGGEFFTGDNEDEISQGTLTGTMTDVDLTDGAVSNGGTGLKDGLEGPNESPEEDVRNGLTSGTKDGSVDLTASVNDAGSILNRGTGPKGGLNGSTNEIQVLVSSLKVWQGTIPAPAAKPSSNTASNGSNKLPDVDLTGDTEAILNGPSNGVDNSNINMSRKDA